MKKLKALIFAIFITGFSVCLAGCSKGIPAIDMPTYFNTAVSSTIYKNNSTSNKSLTLESFTTSSANTTKLDKYLDFTFTAKSSWIYKMYIEKIEFFVYTNTTPDTEMTFTIKISNLASEDKISSISQLEETQSIYPTAYEPYKLTLFVNKVVATATGMTMSIDISESSELLLDKNNPDNNFKWQIYGLKIYGESREYSK